MTTSLDEAAVVSTSAETRSDAHAGLTEESASAYVRGLFEHVLGRSYVAPDELSYWVAYLLRTGDAVEVFTLFVSSDESRRRSELLDRSRTAYPAGHFYSPVVDRTEVETDALRVFGRESVLGVELDPPGQEAFFLAIADRLRTLPFSDDADGRHRYRYSNSSYGFGDACIYWSLLGTLRPSRIVEIGSGFTSALALDAIDKFGLPTRCTFIDPYPDLLYTVAEPIGVSHTVLPQRVQDADPQVFETLGQGDLLFIDSSHVVKTGSDVHYEMTQILPRLAPGVIVHFHDVFYPFEYPVPWVLEDNKSWNELYVLQTFLMYNERFRVMFFNDYFAKKHASVVRHVAPQITERFLLNPGGGLWLRKT